MEAGDSFVGSGQTDIVVRVDEKMILLISNGILSKDSTFFVS